MLDWVADVYLEDHKWPTWAWLEEKLERRNLSAVAVYGSFVHESRVNYGMVWPARVPAPMPEDRVGLTIAGLAYVDNAFGLVRAALKLISALGIYRNNIELDPFDTARPLAPRDFLLQGELKASPYLDVLPQILGKEPATWHCSFQPSFENWTEVSLAPEVRRFDTVQDVDNYLSRLASLLGHMQKEDVATFYSPFSLPAAADYLNAVWQLKFGDALFNNPGIERSARLASPASSADEADSRLSALAELLKTMRVPDVAQIGGSPLERLIPYLESELPPESHPRIREVVSFLDAARQIRAGMQHSGVHAKTIASFSRIGISYPVYDWFAAWERIQTVAAHSFDAIREELQASP